MVNSTGPVLLVCLRNHTAPTALQAQGGSPRPTSGGRACRRSHNSQCHHTGTNIPRTVATLARQPTELHGVRATNATVVHGAEPTTALPRRTG